MRTLLEFLVQYCVPLFEKHGVRFVDSETGPNAFAGASILLESRDVQIHLATERGQITWEMRSVYDAQKRNWFAFDLLAELIGLHPNSGVMEKKNATLLAQNIDEIMLRFEKVRAIGSLEELARLRAAHR